MKIKVMIVDDDELIRSSLKYILASDTSIEVVNTSSNGDEAYNNLQKIDVDVILMDIRMPICNGVAATKKISSIYPDKKIIILTTFDDDDYIFEALKNGAKGFLLKNVSPDKIIEAIKIVYQGNLLLHPDVTAKLTSMLQMEKKVEWQKYDLTEAEVNIMKLISEGFSNKEIADHVFLSEGTVKNKISDILDKLHLRDRTQIAIFYLKGGNK
ncbi:response regulator transcription factor [Alkaliphilus peptidifermentans]|uniref:Stage 0 sporulation protein A homolog n=1 Tax=Alkaliphilus peptidifermentans DSM 18978 TaxID=1120976 RepID=A0A1G5LEA6_9FIRM|nr:response regulator transcription factor [Alkaliphilus peptidifermentans]SCZ10499.1 two component transcriptional regulator, LuxR family [Alkaliphilus peptidifermentans DSM 18978]